METNRYITYAMEQEKKTAFYVATIGTVQDQKIIHRPLGIEDFQFLYTVSGTGNAFISGSTFELKKGTLFFLPPNTPHEYSATSDKWVTKYITFNGCSVESFFNFSPATWDNLNDFDFEKWYDILFRYKNMPTFINSTSVTLYAMLLELKDHVSSASVLSRKQRHILTQAMHQLSDSSTPQLDTLAKHLGISPSYFCRIFKEYSGYRPFEYMNLVKIQKAKALLKNSQIPISEISSMVGYENHSYFSKLFKKTVGITPTQYRNNN